MSTEIVALSTTDSSFESMFEEYRNRFLYILSHSYQNYYGDDYQLQRIIEEQSVLFLALVDTNLVGASYVKKNLRRGGTAVYPEQYRRMGIGERLVRESLRLFPKQYTILSVDNDKMLCLMEKVGFKRVSSPQEVENIVHDETAQISEFEFVGDYLVFKRYSKKREITRDRLTLLHTFY